MSSKSAIDTSKKEYQEEWLEFQQWKRAKAAREKAQDNAHKPDAARSSTIGRSESSDPIDPLEESRRTNRNRSPTVGRNSDAVEPPKEREQGQSTTPCSLFQSPERPKSKSKSKPNKKSKSPSRDCPEPTSPPRPVLSDSQPIERSPSLLRLPPEPTRHNNRLADKAVAKEQAHDKKRGASRNKASVATPRASKGKGKQKGKRKEKEKPVRNDQIDGESDESDEEPAWHVPMVVHKPKGNAKTAGRSKPKEPQPELVLSDKEPAAEQEKAQAAGRAKAKEKEKEKAEARAKRTAASSASKSTAPTSEDKSDEGPVRLGSKLVTRKPNRASSSPEATPALKKLKGANTQPTGHSKHKEPEVLPDEEPEEDEPKPKSKQSCEQPRSTSEDEEDQVELLITKPKRKSADLEEEVEEVPRKRATRTVEDQPKAVQPKASSSKAQPLETSQLTALGNTQRFVQRGKARAVDTIKIKMPLPPSDRKFRPKN